MQQKIFVVSDYILNMKYNDRDLNIYDLCWLARSYRYIKKEPSHKTKTIETIIIIIIPDGLRPLTDGLSL